MKMIILSRYITAFPTQPFSESTTPCSELLSKAYIRLLVSMYYMHVTNIIARCQYMLKINVVFD